MCSPHPSIFDEAIRRMQPKSQLAPVDFGRRLDDGSVCRAVPASQSQLTGFCELETSKLAFWVDSRKDKKAARLGGEAWITGLVCDYLVHLESCE